MGISADLIYFYHAGKDEISDLNDISLYKFLPSCLHDQIQEQQTVIYDMDYYRQQYNEPGLYIMAQYPNGKIILSNEVEIEEPMTTIVSHNVIKYEILCYIGGRELFRKDIFKKYDKRKNYPYLWNISEVDQIMKKKDILSIQKFYEHLNHDNVWIDLNY